jgi:hypothetical protein
VTIALAERPTTEPRPAPSRYRDLHDALDWFRDAWETALTPVARIHEGYTHVADGDHLGGPAWHRRFIRFLVVGAEHYEPVRMAWARMRYSGWLEDRTGAAFLFVLACRDFDVRSAGLEMLGHCVCARVHLPECTCSEPDRGRHQHGPCPSPSQPIFEEYVAWYTERAIGRLRWHIEHPPAPRLLDRPEWMDRIGFRTTEATDG